MPHYLDTLKQLGFKDLTPQQKGKGRVSSLSSISRQLFKTHYDGYHPRTSRYLATALKRYINTRPKHERKTPEFVGEIRRKLLCLHEYNIQIAKMKFKYPRSEQLDALLVLYVELECGLLYGSYREVDQRHESEVQHSVLRLLKIILHDALHNSEVPLKTTIRACNKALLKLFATVRADCVTENRLVANVIMELLDKLGLLEEVNQLKGKNIPFYQDTCLRDPLVSTIRQNLATSDYESDIDSDEEPDIPMVTDDIFYSNSSNQKSFQPRSLFVNEVGRQMYKTNSDVIKVSQRLKNSEPQPFFGKKEIVSSDWYSASSEQMISNNFSRQYNSFNAQSKFNELGSCSSDVNLKQKGTFQHESTSSEEKAVKSSSLENQAQKASNHFPNDSTSNDFFLKQSLHNITQEANLSKNLPQSEILREDEGAIEQNPTQSIFNNTDSDATHKVSDLEIEDNSGVVEVDASTATESNHKKGEMGLTIANTLTDSNSDIQTVKDTVSEIFDISKAQETTSKSADVSNFECILVEETNNECSKNSVLNTVDHITEDTTTSCESIHNQVIEVEGIQTETVELLEPTTVESPPTEDTIDLDSIPDTNGFRSNKTSVSESISNGLVTIEILSDEDDDVADYTFISSKEKGETQQMNTTPTNLLQLKDIKLEENEENRSPSFSIENSDSESQNFVNTNNSGSRNSDSAGFNGLRSNPTNGSVKEAEIVISDSEDDVVDVSEDEDVVVNDSLTVPTVDLDPVVETETSVPPKKSYGDDPEDLVIVQNEDVETTAENENTESTPNIIDTELINSAEDSNHCNVRSIDGPCVEEIPEINSESIVTAEDREHEDFREETNNVPKETSHDRNVTTELNDNSEIAILQTTEECSGTLGEEISLIEEEKQSDIGEEDLNHVINEDEHQNETDDIQVAADALVKESEEITDMPEDQESEEITDMPEDKENEEIVDKPENTSYERTKLSSTSDCINDQPIISTNAQTGDSLKEVEATYVTMDSTSVSKNTEYHEDMINEPELDSHTESHTVPEIINETEHQLEIPAIPTNEFINEKRVTELLEQSTEAENEQENNIAGTIEATEPSNILDEQKYEEEQAADIAKTPNVVSEPTVDSRNELQDEESVLVEEIRTEAGTVPSNIEVSEEPCVTENEVDIPELVIEADNSGSCQSIPEENVETGTVPSNVEVSKEPSVTENDSLVDTPEPVVEADNSRSCQSISEEDVLIKSSTVPSNVEVSKEPSITGTDSLVGTFEPVVEADNSRSCQSISEEDVLIKTSTVPSNVEVSKEPSITGTDSLVDTSEPVVEADNSRSCQSISEEDVLIKTGTVPSNAEVSKEPSITGTDSLVDTPEPVIESDISGSCQSMQEGNVANEGLKKNTPEVIDYPTTVEYEQPIASAGEVYANVYQEPPVPPTYDSSVNLSTYNQQLSSERATEIIKDIVSPEVLPQKLENTTTNESFFYKSSLTSTLNEVEYVEYSPEKKVNGDLELLANIAADQETLAVKTDSEKEVLDTVSDVESVAKITSTPRRRKSKVRLDYEKKILARETLPRAVKQFQRKHPVKHKTSSEDLKSKRITRNRANKAKLEELEEVPKQPKCKPHDFISVENRTVPPPTNNVFAQKRLMDTNTTSEDSNDSCESMLFIDLSEAGKTAEKTVKSVYEEDTVDDLLEFVTTEQAVCISIPENEENSNSLHILKQMEDFMDKTVPQKKTGIEVSTESKESESVAENIYFPENLTVGNRPRRESNEGKNVAKTTDHSIENILNKTPPNGELKTTSFNTTHAESEVFFSSVEQKIEKEMLPVEQETLLPPNEKIQDKEKTPEVADEMIADKTPDEPNDLAKTNKESLVTEVSKDVALTEYETEQSIVQVEPENLSVKRSSVDQNEESCEKIFKTKAAMKAYEQPNPCVVLKKSAKTELVPKKSGMRTRSRSKGSEDDTLKRTTDIASVVPTILSVDTQTDDSMELDKSNETSQNTSTSLETSTATSIDDSLTEKSEVPSECLREPENLTKASGLEDENFESTLITEEVSTLKTSQNEIEDLSVESHLSERFEKPQLENNQQALNEGNELTTENPLVEVESSVTKVIDDTVPLSTDLSKMDHPAQNLDNIIPSEGELPSQEEPVNLSPVKTKSIEKVTVAKEEKGRSLEKTIKKMKEKIVESEKYKKEQDSSKPSTEMVESEEAKKELDISKTSTDSSIYEAENEMPTQIDESQIPIDKIENQKKNERVAPREETKDKPGDSKKKEISHHKKGISRSPSKSRTSDKRHDHSIDKEKSSRKDRSRSSSKSRSVDKHHKHSDRENDRTRRSKSKSVDEKDKKSRGSDQEELNGHRKRRSRSSSKSKNLEEKTRISEKSSSKHKPSDSKDKQSTLEEKDRHKKRSSKSPSKSSSSEAKAKHSQRSDSDKGKGRDKSEEKSKTSTSKSDNKTKSKTEETSQSSKDKLIATDAIEKQKEVSKVTSSKSHRSKSKHQNKSGENISIKSTEHNLKNDEKVNDKHRDSHKSKSKDPSKGQETSLKPVRERHSNEILKNDDQAVKSTGKSSRSHSREKAKSESSSRTEKREKSSSVKDKVKENDKKTNRRSEEPKENGTSITKDKSKEKSYHHKGHKENSVVLSTESNLNDPLGNKNSQEKSVPGSNLIDTNLIEEKHPSRNKNNQKNLKVAIPKKRKYEAFEDSKESSPNSSEPKIQKLSTEIVVQPDDSNIALEATKELNTETAVQLNESNAPTETYSPKEDQRLQKSSEQITLSAKTEALSFPEVSKDLAVSSTEDLSFEAFATGIKDAVASERTEENENTHNIDVLVPPVVPPLQKNTEIQIEENKDSAPCFDEALKLNEIDGVEERSSEDTEISTSVKITQQVKNVEEIPSLQPVYVSPFSTAPTALDMHMLSTTTAPSGKDFSVSLPLVPGVVATESISSAIVVPENLTSKVVSLPTSTTVQSTPSCSTTGMFAFNEEPETDNQENLNATDLFDASLGLGTTSIAEISTSMTLVQSLGPSTINFINDVSDNTEIDMQQSDKPNSFNSNFPRRTRVTEIRCFVEKESTADHNYTLGDPLLGGNNEDKNLLTTGLSLSDSPEEFPLNVSNLEELSFNENNFIGENGTLDDLGLLLPCKKEKPDFDNIIDDDTPKPEDVQTSIKHLNMLVGIPQPGHLKTISVDHSIDHTSNTDCSVSLGIDYAVNKLLNLGSGEASSQTNFFSTMSDIANMNIMESNVSSLHPGKETLEEPITTTAKNKDESGGITSICNIIESNPSQHAKQTQESNSKDESSSIASICNSYASALHSDSNTLNNQKVVVEPVEQCVITSMDQLKKNYISEPCERLMSKPVKTAVKAPSAGKPSTFATFVQSVKRDKNDNAKKKNEIDEMEKYTIRRNNRTPVFPPKKKTAIQQPVKSTPEKKSEVLTFDSNVLNNNKPRNASDTLLIPEPSNECRIRVKTDLIKASESKNRINSDVSHLDYINENDQNIASEVVLPFSKPSPTNSQEKKTPEAGVTKHNKHARFDKSGNDYIMENIINAHTDSKIRKNKVPITPEVAENSVEKKRKSNFVDGDTSDSEKHTRRSDKRQRKSDDECDKSRTEPSKAHTKKSAETSHNSKPKALSTDEIFDQLLRQGSVNQLFVQKSNEQKHAASRNESNISPELKNRGYTTVPDTKRERMAQPQRAASHFHESAKSRDNSRHSLVDADNRRRPGYTTGNYGAPSDRRYADKKPFSDSSPKRVMRNSSHSYSSKSDPCFSREHPYRPRDRRSSTEHVNNSLVNSSRSEEGSSQDDDDYSWIAKFSGSGLFRDTPSDLFMPPGTKREDASS